MKTATCLGIAAACTVVILMAGWLWLRFRGVKKGHVFDFLFKKPPTKGTIMVPEIVVPKSRLVVSFTTIPSRMPFLQQTIDLLMLQSLQPDIIYVCIPNHSVRLDRPYVIPALNIPPHVRILRTPDYGPATKLFGCIPYESDPNTMIITLDDDQQYAPDVIKILVAYAHAFPSYCLGFEAASAPSVGVPCYKNRNPVNPLVKYLEGFGGVLYRRWCIIPEMTQYYRHLSAGPCFKSDDLVISTWLNMQAIPLMKICDFGNTQKTDATIDAKNPLHLSHRNRDYAECHEELEALQHLRKYVSAKCYYFMADKHPTYQHPDRRKLDPSHYEGLASGDVVCIQTRLLKDFIRKVWQKTDCCIFLITTDCDSIVPGDVWRDTQSDPKYPRNALEDQRELNISFREFVDHPRILHWWSSNVEDRHLSDKLEPIPLGVDYHSLRTQVPTPFLQDKQLQTIARSLPPLSERPLSVLCTFQFNNTSKRFKQVLGQDRNDVWEAVRSNPLMDAPTEPLDRSTLWARHAQNAFVLSPSGNGFECHRTWEALILGSIPIVDRSPSLEVYAGLPVVVVDDWSELTLENLRKWRVEVHRSHPSWEKLTTAHWKGVFAKWQQQYHLAPV